MITILLLSIILPLLLISINLLLFKKKYPSREKISPFECGFDPSILPRNSFSLKFYLISLVFLIFDIEIALILPTPILTKSLASVTHMSLLTTFFMIILLLGLMYEWHEGALNWIT